MYAKNIVKTAATAANNATKSATPGLLGAVQGVARQDRPISTVSSPTQFNSKGGVTDPGHIQLQTSAAEQEKYGLAPVYGKSPNKSQPIDPNSRERVESELPDGRSFKVGTFTQPANPFDQDKPIPTGKKGYESVDHGELNEGQAAALKDFQASPDYEVSGKKESNCVHEYHKAMQEMGLVDGTPIHKHTTPDQMAQLTSDVRTNAPVAAPKPLAAPKPSLKR